MTQKTPDGTFYLNLSEIAARTARKYDNIQNVDVHYGEVSNNKGKNDK